MKKGLSMSHQWIYGTIVAVALVQTAFASGPSHFRANPVFNGTSLAGGTPLRPADWRVEKGEIVGTPKTPQAVGWCSTVLSGHGFFASFRCMSGCKTGAPARRRKPRA
jgi:hypothetical protein